MRERYASSLRNAPRVLVGLPYSWPPSQQVMRHTHQVTSVAFSPDGSRIVSGSEDDNKVRVWNTMTGEKEGELKGHMAGVKCVTFSHNGLFIVSGSCDCSVRVWDMSKWETKILLEGHWDIVWSVGISHDDKLLVSGSGDHSVRIWDTNTGNIIRQAERPSRSGTICRNHS